MRPFILHPFLPTPMDVRSTGRPATAALLRRASALLVVLAVGLTVAAPQPSTASNPLTFTNAGSTGRLGPAQAEVDTAYAGTDLDADVTVVTQGVQEWVVPQTGRYRFTVVGAHGAAAPDATNTRGGRGALITAERTVTEGTRLFIVVGQAGSGVGGFGGGGGASFVNVGSRTGTDALIVAGGGGGTRQQATVDGGDASVEVWGLTQGSDYNSPSVAPSLNNTENNTMSCVGGQDAPPNANGDRTNCWTDVGLGGIGPTFFHGDGGAGWNGDGHRDGTTSERAVRLGDATVSPIGGEGNGGNADGGFGGGGSGTGGVGGGGGGGYTGGDGGTVAGGGGSFVAASFESTAIGIDTGRSFARDETPVHGYVTIELLPSAPTLAPTTATSITTTSAVLAGEVTADGGATVTERGVVWSTGTGPELGASGVESATSGTGIGTFTLSVADLTPDTTYHARAYAMNSVGTSYGASVTFSTVAVVPPAPPPSAQADGPAEASDGAAGPAAGEPPVPTSVPAGQGSAPHGTWVLVLAASAALAAALSRAPHIGARLPRARAGETARERRLTNP